MTAPTPAVFFSSQFYVLGKQYGLERAKRMVAQDAESQEPEFAAVRTLRALRHYVEPVAFAFDVMCSSLPKLRSRMAQAFWNSGARIWVSCDDDVELDVSTMGALLEVMASHPSIACIVPCLLRGQDRPNVHFAQPLEWHRTPRNGVVSVSATMGGFGCVAMTRAAMAAAREPVMPLRREDLRWRDEDGTESYALFHPVLDPETHDWFGEDYSFFLHLPEEVQVRALLEGVSVHDGQPLRLKDLAAQLMEHKDE